MPITLTASDPTPDLRPLQRYLDEIRYPRQRADIRGTGVTVRVIDGGWRMDHEALRGQVVDGPNQQGVREMDIRHGTSTMGILAGQGSIQGMIPWANFELRLWFTLQDELRQASRQLSHGDILLIERDLGAPPDSLPVETSPDYLPAILDCVSRGIVVVEPAGNSGRNIDPYVFDVANRPIMVAGSFERDGQISATGSTSYGTRIDVCAPSRQGITCGPADYIDGPDPNRHYGWFDGTSMASAIVAGVCAGINSARLAAGKPMLGGREMRDLLVSTGRDTVQRYNDPIGKFVDMTRALQVAVPSPDFDQDGKVGWSDWWEFVSCWNAQDLRGDFDWDGTVGWRDFNVLRRRMT